MSKTFLSLGDAFVYSAECQLATVKKMAVSKYTTKADYRQQIDIAQEMVDQVIAFRLALFINIRSENLTTSKAALNVYAVLSKYDGRVSEWAKELEVAKVLSNDKC